MFALGQDIILSRFKLPNKMDKFIKRKNSIDDNESEIKRFRAANPCDKAPKARPKRQYCDDYLKYGFHWTGSEDSTFPTVCHLWRKNVKRRYGTQQIK